MPADELEGAVVTIFSACGEEQCKVFEQNFVNFEAETGIDVVVEGSGDFEQLSVVRAEAGDPPDFFNFPQPGLMADMYRDGFLVDMYDFLATEDVSASFNDAWIQTGTVDGALAGLWHSADVKSLVWYPKEDFDANGFEIPETWDEMIALTDTIAGMGVTPWCVGIESASATGWVATDWIEDIMLRTTSPENYDKWTTGELPFSSPEVKNAFEVAGEIFFNPDYVVGGTTGILTTAFGDSPLGLFEPRTCYLHRQASFIPNFFPEDAVIGVDVDYFYLPPIDLAYGKPVLGSGNLLSMGKDTPAGRAVAEFLLDPASLEAEVKAGNALPVINGIPDEWYPSTTALGFAQILANADTFRFDGSDLMPGAVGAGSFWTGATDWISGDDLDTVLAEIDASWPSE
jgi:alpha-glucoside transport system substrate-binding protein